MKKDEEEFILIFEHGDTVRAAVVQSLLEDSGIVCLVKSGGVQNLFGLGSIGGMNPLVGTIKIFIRREDKREAERLLAGVEDTQTIVPEEEQIEKPATDFSNRHGQGFLSKLRRWFIG